MFWMEGMMGDNTPDNTGAGGEPRAKKPRKRYDIQKTASCTVCGDLAAEHLHYGGIACYSCRAFFRRTVNSNRPILDCSGSQNCKINKETRKRCQWCRFEKCKLVGMKTTWVLTEDDKTKLAIRRCSSPVPGINVGDGSLTNIDIKKEESQEGTMSPGSENSISVKQRHNSSPLSASLEAFSHTPSSPYFSPAAAPQENAHPFFSANQFYAFQPGFNTNIAEISPGQSFYQGFPPGKSFGLERPCPAPQQATSLFPLNINKMQVSLSGGGQDGVSFTIETHNKPQASREGFHNKERTEGEGRRMGWGTSAEEQPPNAVSPLSDTGQNYQGRHHQHTRTIFRCVSNESSSQPCASPDPGLLPGRAPLCQASAWADQDSASQPRAGMRERQDSANAVDPSNVHVWKLDMSSGRQSETGPQLKSFSLQETLFVEQLAAIDERVRHQVPMDQEHVRSFLNTSMLGTFISKMTIMHAYQTCIKRVVRFANSLQDFVELPPDDMQKLLVANTVSIINIRIVRWLHPSIDLRRQLMLCGGSKDLFQEAVDMGKLTEYGRWRVNYDDLFTSPWCCDSYFEDRYDILMKEMHTLNFDSTIIVLLSVMCLFDCTKVVDLTAHSTVISHGQKFAILLQRYLLEQEDQDSSFGKYQEGLSKLREMAEILINKRLIC